MERLFNYFMPENYQLELRVNKETEEVQGHVIILGQTRKTELKLHARDLKISKILIDQKPVDFTIDSENQLLKINNIGEEQQITVDIRYTFKLSHSMIGMYLSTYKNQGREEHIVSTQFESHYARMTFPCIDEPEAKATFDLKIIDTDIEDTILSNMPILSERVLTYTSVNTDLNPKENANALNLNTEVSRKIVIFKTTPKMSTYLLAICIGKFNKISGKNQHGVEVTTYGALNQPAERLEFSNQIAMESLDFYDQLFGIPYPLPKLDQVAIPDFDAGAMENWGLVTYRESCLLVDQNTPLRPEWKIWQDYFTEDCLYALRRDSLKNVQSVQQTVSDPAEIDSLFDGAIVYAKGSHLIFMLMRLMTEYNFFQGLKSYFQKFQYQNTTGDDLWVCLQEFADFNIKDMMDSWIMQPGFPLINGKKQQRFFADGSTDQTTWVLPKITDDMSGHYLIKLSEVDFQQKIRDFKDLSFEQKLRLLIDRSLLMRTPYINTSSILDLLMEFKQEKQESIWQIIVTIIANLKIFFPPTSEYFPLFQKYLFSLASYNIRRLGLKSDSDTVDDLKLRPLVLNFAIYAEDQGIMSKLAALYDQKIGEAMNFAKVSPELLDTVVDAKYRFSKETIFDHLLNRYQNEASPVYKSIILETLASSRNQNHIEKLIALLEDQDIIRLQDHVSFLASLLSNHWSKQLVLTWFYNHWNYIKEITKNKSIDDYVRIVGARVSDQIEAEQFREFCDQERSNPAVARAIKIAEYGIKITLEWQKREADNIYKKIQTV